MDIPPIDTAPPVLSERVVGERDQYGNYPDYGPQKDPAGTVIDNPHASGAKLIKVIQKTPFGLVHKWRDYLKGKAQ